jgi:hypothetical protein
MQYKALVSAHIFLDEKGSKDVEVFNFVHNDKKYTGIFDDIDHALLEQIEVDFINEFPQCETKEHFFMAIVKADFVVHQGFDYTEYDVEYSVNEIKEFGDITA